MRLSKGNRVNKKHRVLITGGAGFIGSHVAERLVASGSAVRVLDNLSTGRRENLASLGNAVELVEGDIRDAAAVRRCAEGRDAIVHLAAIASVAASIEDPVGTHQANFDGTLNVLEAARQLGVPRVVYASSASLYGDNTRLPLSEDERPQPLSPYAADKLSGEHYLGYYARQHGLKATSFRFFNIFGPRQDPLSPYSGVISIFVDRARQGLPLKIFGDGRQTRDFVYVADLADILCESLDRPLPNPSVINVGRGQAQSLLDLVSALEALLGHSLVLEHAAPRPGDIVHSCADVRRLHELFGRLPGTSLTDGLRELLAHVAK